MRPRLGAPYIGVQAAALPEVQEQELVEMTITRLFRRWLIGWTVFFVLAWFLNHDLKFLVEVFAAVLMAAVAAYVSTLIHFAVREFLSKTESSKLK